MQGHVVTIWTLAIAMATMVSPQDQRSNPYLQAGSGLRPQSPARGGQSPARAALDRQGRDLLQKFDDYLFDNLESSYYRLTHAFKDVVKKTLDKCSCDAGAKLTV